jgi:hypothetical protein
MMKPRHAHLTCAVENVNYPCPCIMFLEATHLQRFLGADRTVTAGPAQLLPPARAQEPLARGAFLGADLRGHL